MKILPTKWVTLTVSLTVPLAVSVALSGSLIACTPKTHKKAPDAAAAVVKVNAFDGDFIDSAEPTASPADAGLDATPNMVTGNPKPAAPTNKRPPANPENQIFFKSLNFDGGKVSLTFLADGMTTPETLEIGKTAPVDLKKQRALFGTKVKDKSTTADADPSDYSLAGAADKASDPAKTVTSAVAQFIAIDGLKEKLINKPGLKPLIRDWLADNRVVIFNLSGDNLTLRFLNGEVPVDPSKNYPVQIRASGAVLEQVRDKVQANLDLLQKMRTAFLAEFGNVDLVLIQRSVRYANNNEAGTATAIDNPDDLKPEIKINGGVLPMVNPIRLRIITAGGTNSGQLGDTGESTFAGKINQANQQATDAIIRFMIDKTSAGGPYLMININPTVDKTKYAHIGFHGNIAQHAESGTLTISGYYFDFDKKTMVSDTIVNAGVSAENLPAAKVASVDLRYQKNGAASDSAHAPKPTEDESNKADDENHILNKQERSAIADAAVKAAEANLKLLNDASQALANGGLVPVPPAATSSNPNPEAGSAPAPAASSGSGPSAGSSPSQAIAPAPRLAAAPTTPGAPTEDSSPGVETPVDSQNTSTGAEPSATASTLGTEHPTMLGRWISKGLTAVKCFIGKGDPSPCQANKNVDDSPDSPVKPVPGSFPVDKTSAADGGQTAQSNPNN